MCHRERGISTAPRWPAPSGAVGGGADAAHLRTKRGRRLYVRHKAIVESVFGQIKQGRGFLEFLLRGEWALICPTHNMLNLWRALRQCYRRPGEGLRVRSRSQMGTRNA